MVLVRIVGDHVDKKILLPVVASGDNTSAYDTGACGVVLIPILLMI